MPPANEGWVSVPFDPDRCCHVGCQRADRSGMNVILTSGEMPQDRPPPMNRLKTRRPSSVYPTGVKVTEAQMDAIALVPDAFHGDWHYTNCCRYPLRGGANTRRARRRHAPSPPRPLNVLSPPAATCATCTRTAARPNGAACYSAARPSWSGSMRSGPRFTAWHGRCRAPRAAGYVAAPRSSRGTPVERRSGGLTDCPRSGTVTAA